MILREYVYLDDQRLALFDLTNSDAIFYYINDHLGTAQILLDGQGVVVWQGNYKPFGEVDVAVNNVANYFRFPGQIFDIESGLHYNWNRYYNPQTGRYISLDPIGLDGGLNLYAYVGNDPVNWGDPNGEYSDPTGKYTKPISRPGIPPPNAIGGGTSLGTILTTPVSATTPAIVVAASIDSFGIGYGLTSLAIDVTYLDGGFGSDLYDLIYPPIEMTAVGNQADTGIEQDYIRYESEQRCEGKKPLDKCAWLKLNKNKYRKDRYDMTYKDWKCRKSRATKDDKNKRNKQ